MNVIVVGAGYVGLVSAACLAEHGHHVVCVDQDADRTATINAGDTTLSEPDLREVIRRTQADGRLQARTDLEPIDDADVIFIAVGTPTKDDRIDLSQVKEVAGAIGNAHRESGRFTTVVVRSTVVPGTTDGTVRQVLEQTSGARAGQDFGLGANPEFLREGSAVRDFREPDRIVIGVSDTRTESVLRSLYAPFDCPIVAMSPRNAELTKYASNALLATLISFANELAGLCERFEDTDVDTVMDALALDRRLSPLVAGERVSPDILSYLRAGSGFGGSCLPKDVLALAAFARDIGGRPKLLDAVVDVNRRRPEAVVDLAERAVGTLSDTPIALLGLAFKPGTNDLRDSPALRLARLLRDKGANVVAYDPEVRELGPDSSAVPSVAKTPSEALEGADAAIIATAWPEFAGLDWDAELARMRRPIVVDGRNLLARRHRPDRMIYLPIGRCLEETLA